MTKSIYLNSLELAIQLKCETQMLRYLKNNGFDSSLHPFPKISLCFTVHEKTLFC